MKKFFFLMACIALTACSASAQRAPDGRILLTSETREKLQKKLLASECDQTLLGGDASSAAPTTTVPYPGSNHFPITAELPYNPAWGTPDYASLPYEEHVTEQSHFIGFGPVGLGEGCSIGHTWTISAEGTRTKEDVVRRVNMHNKDMYAGGVPAHVMPVLMKLGGHDAIRYVSEGFCATPVVYVFGFDQTYRLEAGCMSDSESDKQLEMLGTIVESMELR